MTFTYLKGGSHGGVAFLFFLGAFACFERAKKKEKRKIFKSWEKTIDKTKDLWFNKCTVMKV